MNTFQTIWDRLISKNPVFFNAIIWIACFVFGMAQTTLWVDNYHHFLNEAWRAMLDDMVASSITAGFIAQLTKRPPENNNGEQNKPS